MTLTSADVTGSLGFTPYNATNPAGFQTAAQVAAAVPAASTTVPAMDGAAAVGTGTTWARADHVHPTDTSRYAASNPSGFVNTAGAASAAPVQSVAGRTGAVTLTHTDITDWTATLAPYALLASPTFTGTPSLPTGTTGVTQTPTTSNTSLATTAYVKSQNYLTANQTITLSGDVAGSGATAITTTLATVNSNVGTFQGITVNAKGLVTAAVNQSYAPLASPTFTGTVTIPAGAAISGYAPLASPVLTGTPAAPTATAGTNTTQLATTAFVMAAIGNYLPLAGGTLTGPVTHNAGINFGSVFAPSQTDCSSHIALYGAGATAWGGINITNGSLNIVAGAALAANFTPSSFSVFQPQYITVANPSLALNATASGQARQLFGQLNNQGRWTLQLGNAVAESGSNAGSNFQLLAYSDTGTQLGVPIAIDRAQLSVAHNAVGATPYNQGSGGVGNAWLVVNKAGSTTSAGIGAYNNNVTRWSVVLADATAEAGSNAGSDFDIRAYTDAGAAATVPTPMWIKRSTGVATFAVAIVNGSSDRRLKENVEPLEGALAKVRALTGVSFNMKASPDKREIGLIAQDVEPVVPEVIQRYDHKDAESKSEERLAIDYPKLTALLIEAIKTLAARVEAFEARAA